MTVIPYFTGMNPVFLSESRNDRVIVVTGIDIFVADMFQFFELVTVKIISFTDNENMFASEKKRGIVIHLSDRNKFLYLAAYEDQHAIFFKPVLQPSNQTKGLPVIVDKSFELIVSDRILKHFPRVEIVAKHNCNLFSMNLYSYPLFPEFTINIHKKTVVDTSNGLQ